MPDAPTPAFPVADAHVDLITHLLERTPVAPLAQVADGPLTLAGLAAGGVRLLACALYVADRYNGPGTAAARLRELMEATERLAAPLAPALTGTAIKDAFAAAAGPPARCGLVENSDALLETDLAALAAAGVRLAGLTHVGRNRLADGNAVASPAGLTAAGKSLLDDLAKAGFALDVAHLAEPGFDEAMARFPGPVLCSHTGLRAFHDVPRNLTDGQAAALIGRGGLVCLTFAPEILSADDRAGLELVVAHIDHLAQRHGPDHLGLGSDFGGFDGTCAGLEDASRFPALGHALLSRGYPEPAVAGILGGNLCRFLAALYPG